MIGETQLDLTMACFSTIAFDTISAFEAFANKRGDFSESIQIQVENRARDFAERRRHPVGSCALTLEFADWEELDAFGASMQKNFAQGNASPACAAK